MGIVSKYKNGCNNQSEKCWRPAGDEYGQQGLVAPKNTTFYGKQVETYNKWPQPTEANEPALNLTFHEHINESGFSKYCTFLVVCTFFKRAQLPCSQRMVVVIIRCYDLAPKVHGFRGVFMMSRVIGEGEEGVPEHYSSLRGKI